MSHGVARFLGYNDQSILTVITHHYIMMVMTFIVLRVLLVYFVTFITFIIMNISKNSKAKRNVTRLIRWPLIQLGCSGTKKLVWVHFIPTTTDVFRSLGGSVPVGHLDIVKLGLRWG